MKIYAIKCNACNSIIFSRAQHDFRWCSCGSIAIDGGFDYWKITGDNFEPIKLELDVTVKELYDDWNKRIDKYGLINGENKNKKSK